MTKTRWPKERPIRNIPALHKYTGKAAPEPYRYTSMAPEIEAKAIAYIRAIRSPAKRTYAYAYLAHLGKTPAERFAAGDPEPQGLTYMAAQAVRLRLAEIIG